MRLDALARYLQDVANDDATEALGDDSMAWVVRRTAVHVEQFPVFREPLTLTTWASGVGSRWAERRTSVHGSLGGHIEAVSLWVHVHLESGRPQKLLPSFVDAYGEAAGGRQVNARLSHGDVPPDVDRSPWTLRFADFDVVAHVNNAIYWAMVEEHVDVTAASTGVNRSRSPSQGPLCGSSPTAWLPHRCRSPRAAGNHFVNGLV
jgi:acyl-ACP thioesterase